MSRLDLHDGHRSGKYSSSASRLYDATLAGFIQHGWTVQSFTEVDRRRRGNALADVAEDVGGRLLRGPDGALGESAIIVGPGWRVLAWDYYVLIEDLIGMRGKQVMVICTLQDVATGLIYLRSVTHTASGVEVDWKNGPRSKQYRTAMRRWRKLVRQWRRRWRPDGERHVADFNLNLLKWFVRAYLKATWPGMKLPRHGKRGTHGSRLIDFGLSRGVKNPAVAVLALDREVSDHRPIQNMGEIGAKKKVRRSAR